jgi:radical SAM protein with 4Fe4S-binding SPASM domain
LELWGCFIGRLSLSASVGASVTARILRGAGYAGLWAYCRRDIRWLYTFCHKVERNDLASRPYRLGFSSMDRPSQIAHPSINDVALTRDCLDPWNYIEISAGGDIRPCCRFHQLAKLGDSGDTPASTIRNNESFRALRQSLLSGQLQLECQDCHIRKTVTVDVLKRRVATAARRAGEKDVLKPQPIDFFRIDIDEKCNLRCDYCMVSSPDYNGVEMEAAVFDRALALLDEIDPKADVHVNGHGETTYHKRWMQMCNRIIGRGFRPLIVTNLAKNYSDEEVELLSRFSRIQVSLDSDDTELMRRVRKPLSVDKVFHTMERIRAAAERRGEHWRPKFTFSVGIYDPSIWTMENFVDRIIRHGSVGLTFWNLVEYKHQKLVKSLDRLDSQQKIRAMEILRRISRKLDISGIRYAFAGDFHGMAPKLGFFGFVRRALGFAYSFTTQFVFGRKNFSALAREP